MSAAHIQVGLDNQKERLHHGNQALKLLTGTVSNNNTLLQTIEFVEVWKKLPTVILTGTTSTPLFNKAKTDVSGYRRSQSSESTSKAIAIVEMCICYPSGEAVAIFVIIPEVSVKLDFFFNAR